MGNTLNEMKNILQGINSRVDETENRINNLEDKEAENAQSEQQEEKRIQKIEGSLRSVWDNFKHTNIASWRCQKENRENKKLNTYLENNDGKIH